MIKTTSLELSKQLKEAEFLQESYFWWIDSNNESGRPSYFLSHKKLNNDKNQLQAAAFLAEEILEKLPMSLKTGQKLNIYKKEDGYHVSYEYISQFWHRKIDNSLVEAAGKMWLYLKENELLPKGE